MRKLNGITINGEYLGNSVVINGMFRAICTISPVIMRDFVQIINKIEKFEEAVKIHNFNCGFDCINIEFGNNQLNGLASLYFKIINGDPELTNCKLIIDGMEYSTFQEKITLPEQNNNDMSMTEEERAEKIRKLKEKKLEELRQTDALCRQKLNNSVAVNNSIENDLSSMAELSEEDRVKLKRQELSERKKKLIEAKKAALQKTSNSDFEVSSSDFAYSSSDNDLTTYTDDNKISKFDNDISSGKSDVSVSDSGQTTVNSAGASTNDDKVNSVNNNENNSETLAAYADDNKISKSDNDISSKISDSAVFDTEHITINSTDVSVNGYKVNSVYNKENDFEPTASSGSVDGTGSSDNKSSAIRFNNKNNSDDNVYNARKKSFEDLTIEEIENMSEEETAELEAELNAGLGVDNNSARKENYGTYRGEPQGFNESFTESLSQSLAQGISEGLTQGLSGLVQGLSQMSLVAGNGMGNQGFGGGNGIVGQGFGDGNGMGNQGFGGGNGIGGQGFGDGNGMGNQGFGGGNGMGGQGFGDGNGMGNQGFGGGYGMGGQGFGGGYGMGNQGFAPQVQYNQYPPNYNRMGNYDEDDLSDLYSDFYGNKPAPYAQDGMSQQQMRGATNSPASEIDALKAELEALKSHSESKEELMTLDEFLAKRKELDDVKEQRRREKLKIVGSRGRVSASALNGGVFVSGKKVYKWGDTKVLNE